MTDGPSGIDIGKAASTYKFPAFANASVYVLSGCGASCIYPLLATKKNEHWRMTGLEVDQASYESAKANVALNGLEDRITLVIQSRESGIFDQLFSRDTSSTYDFCVCNPPFYDDAMTSVPKNRTGKRPPPRNAKTGSQVELSCSGGEVQFIKKIISGSLKFRSRVRVFTTMIGIKNDVSVLVKELRGLGVTNYVETEFCQGRTTRWGLAWSFDEENLYLRAVSCIKSTFVKEPAIFYIPEMDASQMGQKGVSIEKNLFTLLADIDIVPETLPETVATEKRWRVKCRSVTWTNTRRRRRGHGVEDVPVPAKRTRLDDAMVGSKMVLVADIYLNAVRNGHTLQIFYLDGSRGKDACQQILQYIINNFNKLF